MIDLKFTQKCRKQNRQSNLKEIRGLTLADFKISSKTTAIKTV